jgi:hypothetical protein
MQGRRRTEGAVTSCHDCSLLAESQVCAAVGAILHRSVQTLDCTTALLLLRPALLFTRSHLRDLPAFSDLSTPDRQPTCPRPTRGRRRPWPFTSSPAACAPFLPNAEISGSEPSTVEPASARPASATPSTPSKSACSYPAAPRLRASVSFRPPRPPHS